MFAIARSIFWLGAAYMVIKPGVDLPDANALTQQAMTASAQIVATQVQAIPCDTLQCFGGKAIIAAALDTPSLPAVAPMHDLAATSSSPVPYPLPRPDWRESGRPQGA